MPFFHHILPLGLEIGEKTLRIIQLTQGSRRFKVIYFKEFSVKNFFYCIDPEQCRQAIDGLIKMRSGKLHPGSRAVVVSIPNNYSFYFLLNFPHSSKDQLAQNIQKEISYHIPYSIQEIYYDWKILSNQNDLLKIGVVAAPKKIIDQYVSILDIVGLRPLAFEPEFFSYLRTIRLNMPIDTPYLVLYTNDSHYISGIISKQIIQFIHTRAIHDTTANDIIIETIRYYQDHYPDAQTLTHIIINPKISFQESKSTLSRDFNGTVVTTPDLLRCVQSPSPQEASILSKNFGVGIGLTLRSYEEHSTI